MGMARHLNSNLRLYMDKDMKSNPKMFLPRTSLYTCG